MQGSGALQGSGSVAGDSNPASAPYEPARGATHNGTADYTIFVRFSEPVTFTSDRWFTLFDYFKLRPSVTVTPCDDTTHVDGTCYELQFLPSPNNAYILQLHSDRIVAEDGSTLDSTTTFLVTYVDTGNA
jgi:hypothetical protein